MLHQTMSHSRFYKSDAPTESTMNLLDGDESEEINREFLIDGEAQLQELADRIHIEPLVCDHTFISSFRIF